MKAAYYIGVSTTFHDPSIAIINQDGKVVFAESTERYLQLKRAIGCPADPIIWIEEVVNTYCESDVEFYISTTWSDKIKRPLKIISFLSNYTLNNQGIASNLISSMFSPIISKSQYNWNTILQNSSMMQSGISLEKILISKYNNSNNKRFNFDHHLTHAATACYSSSFDEALCLVMDGGGEKGSFSYYKYCQGKIIRLGYNKGNESLGNFYMLITELCRFDPIKGEEWKVMGLSAYGKKDEFLYQKLKSFYEVKNLKIKWTQNFKKTKIILDDIKKYVESYNDKNEIKVNLAFTGQLVFKEYMNCLLSELHKTGISNNLIYTGGCALNSAYNEKITTDTPFKKLYIPSAPGDDGNSLGAAYLAYFKYQSNAKLNYKKIATPYLGSKIDDHEILSFIKYSNFKNYKHLQDDSIYKITAKKIAEGKIIGWVQGRSEFGPRALGNRSILADPRRKDMKNKINASVKFREDFRPFAPSIMDEFGEDYFNNYSSSPYMEKALSFKDDVIEKIPAVVHQNKTGRVQSVTADFNPKYYNLISAFYKETNVPILLNTSFNVMGKPIIHSFADALQVFFNSGMDVLVVNDYLFEKEN